MFRKNKKTTTNLSRHQIISQRTQQRAALSDQKIAKNRYTKSIHHNKNKSPISKKNVSRQEFWQLKKQRRNLLFWLIFSLSLVACGLFLLSQLTAKINIKTTITAEKTQYQNIVEDYLRIHPLERFRFLLDEQEFELFLISKAPEIKSAKLVAGANLTEADVQISFRQSLAKWSTNGKNYYVDKDGVTFENNYFAVPKLQIEDQSGLDKNSDQEISNRRFLSFLGQAVGAFSEHNMTVEKVTLPSDTIRRLDIKLKDRATIIRMTVDRGAVAQVNESMQAIAAMDKRGQRPSYIDVRVDQKVFYR